MNRSRRNEIYSARKPYSRLGESQKEFFRNTTRHLKDGIGPESVFEKPYWDLEYGDMHQSPNLPTVPPLVGGIGGFRCLFSETECLIDAECFAGPEVKIAGGPQEAQAGYRDPEVLEGALVNWTVDESGRFLVLTFDDTVTRNIVKVTFVDGWGKEYIEEIDVTCAVAGCGVTRSDTFTGTNGDAPNVERWRSNLCTQQYTIQSNKLNFDLGNSEEACVVLTETCPINEVVFTAVVDYDSLVETANCRVRLYVMDDQDPDSATEGAYVEALDDGSGKFAAYELVSGSWTLFGTFPFRGNDYGQLKAERIVGGGVLVAGKNAAGGWISFDVNTEFTGPAFIMLMAKTDGSGELAGNWDTFTVT